MPDLASYPIEPEQNLISSIAGQNRYPVSRFSHAKPLFFQLTGLVLDVQF